MPLPVKCLRAVAIKTLPSHGLFHISEEANKESTGLGNLQKLSFQAIKLLAGDSSGRGAEGREKVSRKRPGFHLRWQALQCNVMADNKSPIQHEANFPWKLSWGVQKAFSCIRFSKEIWKTES